ncbi:unnamed protein product, partial [Discosporangium mesarthrocarpum]
MATGLYCARDISSCEVPSSSLLAIAGKVCLSIGISRVVAGIWLLVRRTAAPIMCVTVQVADKLQINYWFGPQAREVGLRVWTTRRLISEGLFGSRELFLQERPYAYDSLTEPRGEYLPGLLSMQDEARGE